MTAALLASKEPQEPQDSREGRGERRRRRNGGQRDRADPRTRQGLGYGDSGRTQVVV